MRTGIFGGTFDPVHNGHLICADAVRRQLALDKVVFVPAGVPPHKIARRITPPEDRLAMLRAAIGEREGFAVSDIECRRRKYTYTYDTLIELRRTGGCGRGILLDHRSRYACRCFQLVPQRRRFPPVCVCRHEAPGLR